MSNTRHATEGSAFRQERFSSSQEYERGLMANLVARRCSVLERAEDRELVWFLQLLSHQPGGIKKLAADLMVQFPDRIASASMRKFGIRPGQIYTAAQVKAVREEVDGHFPLKGEISFGNSGAEELLEPSGKQLANARLESRWNPSNYPAAAFLRRCQDAAAAGLEKHLLTLCLDPAMPVADGEPWYFPTLISTLREFESRWIAERRPAVITSIGEKVFSALDYAAASRRLVIVDGDPRIGKSNAARAWCNLHPGRARYVELESSSDEISLFRVIAKALGVSINMNAKAQKFRQRIEDALQGGDIVLVFDEAHYLLPNLIDPRTLPTRLNWVLTALVNKGVPVAFVTTPQFFRNQKALEERTRWTSQQFVGRIGHYERLPDTLSTEDLQAVANVMLPGGTADSIKALVLYAQSSGRYLGGMDAIAARVRFICQSERRQKIEFRDVKRAIQTSVTPSDESLKIAIAGQSQPARRRVSRVIATPLQPGLEQPATSLPPSRNMRQVLPASRIGQPEPSHV